MCASSASRSVIPVSGSLAVGSTPDWMVDISALARRRASARPIRSALSSPVTHEPTNMTFGFTGMLLKVTISRGEAPTLQVPEEAVVPIGDSHHVRVVDDGDVVRHAPVRVGRRRVGVVEVLSGIDEGDRVIVESVDRVRPGAAVSVVETRGGAPAGSRR